MKIKVILWDIDGTLLNFEAAEKVAIRQCFSAFKLGECTDEMLTTYQTINREYWKENVEWLQEETFNKKDPRNIKGNQAIVIAKSLALICVISLVSKFVP